MMQPADASILHEATLQILEGIGVRLEHDGIVARMLKAGARPGGGPGEVRFPREMVAEYLAMAPRTVTLAARDGTQTRLTGESEPVFWTNPGMYLWSRGTGQPAGERRDLTSTDLGRVACLCDGLENVQGVMGMAMVDVKPQHRDFVGVRVIAENSRKHVRALCFTPRGMEALTEMKRVFPGNWLSVGFTAHGPLRWTNLALSIFEKSAGHGIPTTINGEPMAGVTGPVTLAGAAAVGNAEILSGIVVNQVLEPGRPMIYNLGLAHVFDMRHATAVTGGPENALFAGASAAMGRFYGLPSSSWVSTESVYDDGQASAEMALAIQSHMAAGVGLIWGMGQLESEKTISFGRLVIDNEVIGYCRRLHRGMEVTAETVAYDVIREVGIGGSYLETEHTLENFRTSLWQPRVFNRKMRENCPERLEQAAERVAEEMLAADPREKIGPTEAAELRRIERAYARD
jgi:trimethylamine---corrinoid protein Co-methyltransferase